MKCPDVDEMITLAPDWRASPLAAHVDVCRACRERLELIDALRPAGPLEPVPHVLVDRVMASLPPSPAATGAGRTADFAPGHAVLTFLLASATTAVAGVLAEARGGGLAVLLLLAMVVGFVAAVAEPRLLRLHEEPQ